MITWHRLSLLFVCLCVLTGCRKQAIDKPSGTASANSSTNDPPNTKDRVRVLGWVPRFQLTNHEGQPFGVNELDGKPWIATFVFTRCTQTCPAQTAEMAKLQKELGSQVAEHDLKFVTITVDPTHDTPEVLREYANRAAGDLSSWTFLTGSRADIWNLCKKGFLLPVAEGQPDASSPITHSQNFVLVDRARRIRGYYDALSEPARQKLKRELAFVLKDPPGPITMRVETINDQTGSRIYVPLEIKDVPWLKERAKQQIEEITGSTVFHDFRFVDRRPESGITFVNQVVEDAGKYYKPVHYDHGTGVAVADVDADGLLDIYFVSQLGSNQLCKNLGNGKFRDITNDAGVSISGRIGVTASFADIDNDSDADLYVTTVRGGNLMFENDGTGKFRDISAESGLGYNGHSSAAVFFDYDRDGLLDVFLLNPGKYTTDRIGDGGYHVGFEDGFSGHLMPDRNESKILYRNTGGNRFVDVTKESNLVDYSWSGAASPIDLNEDGWQDLYLVSMQGHDEYYENQGGKGFAKRSREVFPKTPWGSMGIKCFDFDNDGRVDIFITDMHTDMTDELARARRFWYAEKIKVVDTFPPRYLNTDGNHILGNAFFHNQGGGKFREISDEIGAETYWPWGLSVGDLNADGYEDVLVTASMNFPYRYAVNSILLNEQGRRFVDSEFVLGVEPRRDGRTCRPWFELDASGRDKVHVLSRGRSGRIEFWGALGSRSSVIFDLDNDGDLDIVTNDFNSEPMVLLSNLTERKPDRHYLAVELHGTKSNRDGLGARVKVTAGNQTYTKFHDGQSGYLSQSRQPLYFGLAAATEVTRIEIVWPAGNDQTIAGPISIDRTLEIQEE